MELILTEYITPYVDKRILMEDKDSKKEQSKYIKGHIYQLIADECDGFKMPIKKYELIGTLKEFDGIQHNALIMKQVEGEKGTIFTLTKFECQNIGIEFQRGLQLFPEELNWVDVTPKSVPIDVEDEFNPHNLSTYPKCHIDNTIRQIMFKMSNFKRIGDTHIQLPNNLIVSVDNFKNNLNLFAALPIRTYLGYDKYPIKICTALLGKGCRSGNDIVDADGNIFLELHLVRKGRTSDGVIGVEPSLLKGNWNRHFIWSIKNINDNRLPNIRFTKPTISNPFDKTKSTYYNFNYSKLKFS